MLDEREEFHGCYDDDDDPARGPRLLVWVMVFAAITFIGVAVIAWRVF